jgi:putative component of membrane protein insertase Oxa1/YidC/SpoIIIJ protein YidD
MINAYAILLLFVALTSSLMADPWGRDADLVNEPCWSYEKIHGRCKTPLFGQFGEAVITFHQKVISPADGPRSHFYPSSSQYTKESMRRYGFFKGFMMGCDRLMRENPEDWVYSTTILPGGTALKYDPVP